jgi:hypothetical protein
MEEAVTRMRPNGRRFAAVVALMSAGSLLLQYVLLIRITLDTVGPLSATVRYFSYFTILANLLVTAVAVTATSGTAGAAGRFFARPRVRGGVALYIGVTGLVYFTILRHLWQPQGAQFWVDSGLHYAAPLLYLSWWFACVPHGRLSWGDVPRWLVFPAIYLSWSFARGALVHEYPYPFLDVDQFGILAVLRNCSGVFGLFVGLSALLLMVDGGLGRRHAAEARA